MKSKLIALAAITALSCGAASAVSLTTTFIANTANGVGLITTMQTGSLTNVTGTLTIFSTSADIVSVNSSVDTLAEFAALLTADPGAVRSNVAFTNGAVTSSAVTELGAVGNRIYVWIQSNDGVHWGAYKGITVPALGSVVINSASVTDIGAGTSVYSATGTSGFQLSTPEPSTALLGAIGALGLLRRRRI